MTVDESGVEPGSPRLRAPARNRTWNLRFRKPALCPLSHKGVVLHQGIEPRTSCASCRCSTTELVEYVRDEELLTAPSHIPAGADRRVIGSPQARQQVTGLPIPSTGATRLHLTLTPGQERHTLSPSQEDVRPSRSRAPSRNRTHIPGSVDQCTLRCAMKAARGIHAPQFGDHVCATHRRRNRHRLTHTLRSSWIVPVRGIEPRASTISVWRSDRLS